MPIYKSYKIRIDRHNRHYEWCKTICIEARSFIDQATYLRRQNFFEGQKTGIYRSEKELCQEFRDSVDKSRLGQTQLTTGIWNKTRESWSSFHALLKKKIKCSLPKYLKRKTQYGKITYTLGQNNSPARIKDGIIYFNGTHKNRIKFDKDINGTPKTIDIIYKNGSFWIIINYLVSEIIIKNDPSRIASIDVGINNLLTVTFNTGDKPIIISGKELKSTNQFYNKKKAELQSQLPNNRRKSHRIDRLTEKRNLRIDDFRHKICKSLSKYLDKLGIGTLVIGWNVGFKSEINIGKSNNQKFVSIPHRKLIETLKQKSPFLEVIETEESYTSKFSFIDQDIIPVYREGSISNHKFSGKRIKRGLYKTMCGILINADVNGSFNIMRKVFPNVIRNNKHGIEGLAFDPVRIKNPHELDMFLHEFACIV